MSYLAVTNHNGVVVPLDKELPAAEKDNLLRRSDSKAIIFSGRYESDMLKLKREGSPVKYFIHMDIEEDTDEFLSFRKLLEKGRQLLESKCIDLSKYEIDEIAMSILLFTSGTTDLAKGVMLSQKNICANIMGVLKTVHVDSNDISFQYWLIHYTYECNNRLSCWLYTVAAIIAFNALRHIQRTFEVKPTILVTVPLLPENMHKNMGSIRKSPMAICQDNDA